MKDAPLIQSLMDWSTRLMRLSMHDFNRFIRANGLSLAQMNVLLHLYYQGSSEVMNFCGLMQISPAGASQLVERMVQQNLVQRSEAPADRRVRLVVLTERGRCIVEDSLAARQVWLEELIAGLSDSQKEALAQSLQALIENSGQLEGKIHP